MDIATRLVIDVQTSGLARWIICRLVVDIDIRLVIDVQTNGLAMWIIHRLVVDIDIYRGITVSTCLSKLFETCILYTYEDYFHSLPLQFGFKQKMGCSHAIFLLRSVMDFYVSKGTTVNIAFLDLSKAFIKSAITHFSRN